jgi:hypothetical protein
MRPSVFGRTRLPLTAWILAGLLAISLLWAPSVAMADSRTAPSDTSSAPAACPERQTLSSGDVPVLAHYYIWYNASSWNRAKKDYPAIARYSSDQISVMRTQAEQARAAGLDGFIVGWRSTETLNSRLATVRNVAGENRLKLAIMYQAQDFNRKPLPPAQVRHDLEQFADAYADDPVFQVLGPHPVVALSGSWHYSEEDLRFITETVASRLMILGTEKSVEGYERVAPAVQGNLYYWSSADPQKTPGYQKKLQAMSDAVHAHCGLWIAPVAPGFDARDVGGRGVVDRRDGDTLRSSWEASMASAPDAVGIISWNEYSENTHIEPSTTFRTRYLDVLGELTGTAPTPAADREPTTARAPQGAVGRAVLMVSVVVGLVLLVAILGIRRRRQELN